MLLKIWMWHMWSFLYCFCSSDMQISHPSWYPWWSWRFAFKPLQWQKCKQSAFKLVWLYCSLLPFSINVPRIITHSCFCKSVVYFSCRFTQTCQNRLVLQEVLILGRICPGMRGKIQRRTYCWWKIPFTRSMTNSQIKRK